MREKLFLFTLFIWQYSEKHQSVGFDGLSRILGASYTNIRTVQLLNQLCNDSQGDDTMARDACYGCFFRASNKPFGYPMLLSISACADLYLNNDDYGHCQKYLKDAMANAESQDNPIRIYCTFLECIREVNKDTLAALNDSIENSPLRKANINKSFILILTRYVFAVRAICIIRPKKMKTNTARPGAEPTVDPRDCVREAIQMFPNLTAVDDVQQLGQLFVNTTACILAKTRCGGHNPITGANKENSGVDLSSKFTMPIINAVLINSNYDINIVQLPFGNGIIDECAKYRNIEQATWPSVQC